MRLYQVAPLLLACASCCPCPPQPVSLPYSPAPVLASPAKHTADYPAVAPTPTRAVPLPATDRITPAAMPLQQPTAPIAPHVHAPKAAPYPMQATPAAAPMAKPIVPAQPGFIAPPPYSTY